MNQTIVIAILTALLAVDQALAQIPSIKANSIFQLITNGLQALVYFLKTK